MGAVEATVSPEAAKADYAQFAQRNLDKLSWLYPLVNNKLGELLHLQLRHDQLFFMKDGQVVESGPALQVLHAPQHDYTRLLVAHA